MSRKLSTAVAAAAVCLGLLGSQVSAATLSGQLDVTGTVNLANSSFTPSGRIDFHDQVALAVIATGDFAPVNTIFEGGDDTIFALNDIDFTSPSVIYNGGGFTFTASSFTDFDSTLPGLAFAALGTITTSLLGFDPTPGRFALSLQDGASIVSFSSTTTVIPLPASALLLLSGLGGIGLIGWRRRRQVATA